MKEILLGNALHAEVTRLGERQMRIRRNWGEFTKGHLSALQFEARWEELTHELEEIGLGKSVLEKYLAYLEKVGAPYAEEIQKDRRPRPDASGGTTTRTPNTWQEAHAVVVESERVKAGSKALKAGALTQQQLQGLQGGKGQDGKGTKGKGNKAIC